MSINIYELETSMKGLVDVSKDLIDLALKDTMTVSHLAQMSETEKQMIDGLYKIEEWCDTLISKVIEITKEQDEREKRMEKMLEEINRKLD